MNHTMIAVSAWALTLLSPLVNVAYADESEQWHAKTSACVSSAHSLFRSCRWELGEEQHETRAHCSHISDRAERSACQQQARQTRQENARQCYVQRHARIDACHQLGEDRYDPDPLLNPDIEFIHPNDIPALYAANPYVSLAAGHTFVLKSGDAGEEIVVVYVTEEIREIQGVDCRIVVDIALEVEQNADAATLEYTPLEVTDDWFAQDQSGNVYYCGEASRDFEDGVITSLDGSFESGKGFAKGGTLIQAFPIPGETHRQEFAPGEAEDIIQYINLASTPDAAEGGENPAFPCAGVCLKTLDFSPLEPKATEFKYYLPGVGFVLALSLEAGEFTGEREELVCVGDSLAILEQPDCQIKDPEKLIDQLCTLSGGEFCEL